MLKEYRLTHRGILVADAAIASRFNKMNDPVSKREAVEPAGSYIGDLNVESR
jgi:hypothetical protein